MKASGAGAPRVLASFLHESAASLDLSASLDERGGIVRDVECADADGKNENGGIVRGRDDEEEDAIKAMLSDDEDGGDDEKREARNVLGLYGLGGSDRCAAGPRLSQFDSLVSFGTVDCSLRDTIDDGEFEEDGDDDGGGNGLVAGAPRLSRGSSLANLGLTDDDLQELDNKGVTPHELAARVAVEVKTKFRRDLPPALEGGRGARDCLARFETQEIVLGKFLGNGEFSNVYEIKRFRLGTTPEAGSTAKGDGEANGRDEAYRPPSYTPEEVQVRRHMKGRERYRNTRTASYAIKHLRPKLADLYDPLDYAQAAADLANEAEFLSALQHPHVIKLRGISSAGAAGFEGGPKGYFLIIDRLNETLDARIRRWKKQGRRRDRLSSNLKGKLKEKLDARHLLRKLGSREIEEGRERERQQSKPEEEPLIGDEQLDVALQIASALKYLHEKSIMFRDLKPQNIGFDVRGDVKIFDFGLATVMPIFGDPYENTYRMSGAGSPRYMAPELLAEPIKEYNLKADVYTFGIVLWQIFSFRLPFAFARTKAKLVDYVVRENGRPDIEEHWPEPIKELLLSSFDEDMRRRPSIQFIFDTLRSQLLSLRDGDGTKLRVSYLTRRRSLESSNKLEAAMRIAADDEKEDRNLRQRAKKKILDRLSLNGNNDGGDQAPQKMGNKLRAKLRRLTTCDS